MITLSPIPFRGWPNALRVANGTAELIVTLDVGPRVLSYTREGSENPFAIFEEQAGGHGEAEWKIRGGHRLWLAPESPDFSYFPDNHPVSWEKIGQNGVRLSPQPEPDTGFQKQIDIILEAEGARVTVVHRIVRTDAAPRQAAPWALSVLAAGGVAILPQPPLGKHPRDLLPNRSLVLWPYTDLSDPRYRLGRRFLTVRQDPEGLPTKIGSASPATWAAYLLKRTLFIKRFGRIAAAAYPDDGCNLEIFTNDRMLELETLGPLRLLGRGEAADLTEGWDLRADIPPLDPRDEDALAAYFESSPV